MWNSSQLKAPSSLSPLSLSSLSLSLSLSPLSLLVKPVVAAALASFLSCSTQRTNQKQNLPCSISFGGAFTVQMRAGGIL